MPDSRAEMERRRLEGAALLEAGLRRGAVARQLGVTRTTVGRWFKQLQRNGRQGLARRRASGRPFKLNWHDRAEDLRELYESAGEQCRTGAGFSDLIFQTFQVRYDPDHMGRIMRRLGIGSRRKLRHAPAVDLAREIARCDREIAEIREHPFVDPRAPWAYVPAMGLADWEREKRILQQIAATSGGSQ
jgi:transposase